MKVIVDPLNIADILITSPEELGIGYDENIYELYLESRHHNRFELCTPEVVTKVFETYEDLKQDHDVLFCTNPTLSKCGPDPFYLGAGFYFVEIPQMRVKKGKKTLDTFLVQSHKVFNNIPKGCKLVFTRDSKYRNNPAFN